MSAIKGHPHKLSAQRVAQIHRWQLLGAAARKGRHRASKSIHHAQTARARKQVFGSYAKATSWGVKKLILPIGFGSVAAYGKNQIPGYNAQQVGKSATRVGRKRRSR